MPEAGGGPGRRAGAGRRAGLIAAADLAVCADEATFAFTEVRIGVIPAVISATVLPRLHPRAAAELYLTGDTFDGRRAAEIGLVTAAVPADELDAAVAAVLRLAGARRARRAGRDEGAAAPAGHRPSCAADLARLSALSTGYFLSDEGREGVTRVPGEAAGRWVPALDD